jgi:Flp pilus assembly protein TadB
MTGAWIVFVVALGGVVIALSTPQPRLRLPVKTVRARWSPWLLSILLIESAAFVWGSPTAALAGPVALVMSLRAASRLQNRSSLQRMQRALPGFTDDLAQQLRSGSSLPGSLVRVANNTPDLSLALRPVLQGLAAGDRLEAALQRVGSNDEALRLVLVTIGLLAATGGPAADTIERVGENVRSVVAGQEEAKALAGQGTASAVVLAVLPALFALLAGLSDQALAEFYVFEWAGAACVTASVLLTGASWFWMDALLWGKG